MAGDCFSLEFYGGNSHISARDQATTPSMLKRALGLMMALKETLPLNYTSNDSSVNMTLDSDAWFHINFHAALDQFLKIATRSKPQPPVESRHAIVVSHYATGEAARSSYTTRNNRKNGPLRCDL